jgi:small subunit ribosomal protein S16
MPLQVLTKLFGNGNLRPLLANFFMIAIRLSRTGKRKQPYYRIVVQDSQKDPWSPAIEVIGNLDPRADRKDAVINMERAAYWLSVGAQPSATVNNLFVDHGLVKGKKVNKITITAARAKTIADTKAKAKA